jgi:Mg-chelatase subunit ChlD
VPRLALEIFEPRILLAANVFTVNSTAFTDSDPAVLTLREAITAANATANLSEPDRIEFDIPSNDGGHRYYRDDGNDGTLSLSRVAVTAAASDVELADPDPDWPHSWFSFQFTSSQSLPSITEAVVIDGYTQPGARANTNSVESLLGLDTVLKIELNGGGSSGGLLTDSATGGSVIRGLVIGRFASTGITLWNGADTTIEGNFIGTDPSGTLAQGNSGGLRVGYSFFGSGGHVIGGATPAARNLISANTADGIRSVTAGNRIEGNLIGTDRTGTRALRNHDDAVEVVAGNNTVGGVLPGTRNILSGNGGEGVFILGAGNFVQGNFIGTDVTGRYALPNTLRGVRVGSADNAIGGNDADDGAVDGVVAARNVIAANWQGGIAIECCAAIVANTRVQGNLIGTDVSGAAALGNGFDPSGFRYGGIAMYLASDSLIGGTEPGAANVIANNAGDGILIRSGAGNAVLGNSIYANGELGIDLGMNNDGVTPNDALDADMGANNLQNFPTLASVQATAISTSVRGTLNGTPNTMFRIELFASAAADASGFGPGQSFLGATDVTTDDGGDAGFAATLPISLLNGEFVTATATLRRDGGFGDTSEFSQAVTAQNVEPPTQEVTIPFSIHGEDSVAFELFSVIAPGTIHVDVDWTGASEDLTVELQGRRRTELADPTTPYVTVNAPSPLSFSYEVTQDNLDRGVGWRVVVRDSSNQGQAAGRIRITKPFDAAREPVFQREKVGLTSGEHWPTTMLQNQFLAYLTATPTTGLHGLISFRKACDCQQAAQLEQLGIVRQSFLPYHNAFGFVRKGVDVNHPDIAAALRGLTPLEPEDKIDPHILVGDFAHFVFTPEPVPPEPAQSLNYVRNADATLQLHVLFAEDTPLERIESILAAESLAFEVVSGKFALATIDPGRVVRLASYDEVEWIEAGPEPLLPLNDITRQVLHVNDVQAPQTDGMGNLVITGGFPTYDGLTGAGVTVGVQENGIDGDHRDLNFVYDPDFFHDTNEHGTHVAGIIAGTGFQSDRNDDEGNPNGGDPFQWRGMAPGATLIDARELVYGSRLREAINLGMDLANHSHVQSVNGNYTARTRLVDREIRGGEIVEYHPLFGFEWNRFTLPRRPHVWSAGNEGRNTPQYSKQVGYFSLDVQSKNAVVVGNWDSGTDGAGGWDPALDKLSGSSSMGPAHDGRIKPDVVAPGTHIFSAGVNLPEVQSLTFLDGNNNPVIPTAGRYRLIFEDENGAAETTDYIAIDAQADEIQQELEELSIIEPGDVRVIRILPQDGDSPDLRFTIGFWDGQYANTNLPLLEVTDEDGFDAGIHSDVSESYPGSAMNGYRFEGGTSMAAPAVAGVMALMLEAWQDTYSAPLGTTIDDHAPLPSTLRALLIQTATDIVQLTDEDADLDGRRDPGEDVDLDGRLDRGVKSSPHSDIDWNNISSEDADGDGILDAGEDVDGDGRLDVMEFDVNGNGVPDPGEDVDCDGDLDAGEDTDGDGILDAGEDVDCDGNFDVAEDADGDSILDWPEDLNGNGVIDTQISDGRGVPTATVGPDFATGWGLVNAQAAVEMVQAHRMIDDVPVPKHIIQDTISQARIKEYDFVIDPTHFGPLKVTLAWDDVEAAVQKPATNPTLVNDLDLELVAPDGTIFLPWQLGQQILDANGADISNQTSEQVAPGTTIQVRLPIAPVSKPNPQTSNDYVPRCAINAIVDAVCPVSDDAWVARSGRDHLNNVEQVLINNPQVGHWKARVIGFDVSRGFQDFSLVGMPNPDLPELVAVVEDKVLLADLDEEITFQWRTENLGPVATGGAFDYQIFLSRDFAVGDDDVPIIDAAQGPLGPLSAAGEAGDFVTWTSTITISQEAADDLLGNDPGETDPGELVLNDVFLLIRVDSSDAILEHNETNLAVAQIARPSNVVLVIDRSGSMDADVPTSGATRRKMDVLRTSAGLFLDLMRRDFGDRLAVVAFNDDVAVVFDRESGEMVNLTSDNVPSASAEIHALSPDDQTNIRGGLQQALDLLPDILDSSHRNVIIFMSDGMRTTGGDPTDEDFLAQFDALDAHVFSVGYGTEGGDGLSGLDIGLLQTLADRGSGGFFHVTERSAGLDKFFVQAVAGAIGAEVIVDPEGEMSAGERQVVQLEVGRQDSIATFVLTWDDPDVALNLALQTPSGQRIDEDNYALYGGRIVRTIGDGHATFQVRLPLENGPAVDHAGSWQMVIEAGDVGASPVRYSASALAESANRLHVDIPPPPDGVYAPGDGIAINATVDGAGRIPLERTVVTVTPMVPILGLGELLSAVPVTPEQLAAIPTEINGETLSLQQRLFLAIRALLGSDPLLRAELPPFVLSGDPDEGYAGLFADTRTDGVYSFLVGSESTAADCTRTQRESLHSVAVPPSIDPAQRPRVVIPDDGGEGDLVVQVTPVGVGGGLVGPGWASQILITSPGLIPRTPIIDHLDGVYSRTFDAPNGGASEVAISALGTTLPSIVVDTDLPAPRFVEPSGGPNSQEQSITIRGGAGTVPAGVTGVTLVRKDAVIAAINVQTHVIFDKLGGVVSFVSADVPAGLPPGTYDVYFESTLGRGKSAPSATFEVVSSGHDFPTDVSALADSVSELLQTDNANVVRQRLGEAIRFLRMIPSGPNFTDAVRDAAVVEAARLLTARSFAVQADSSSVLTLATNASKIDARFVEYAPTLTPAGTNVHVPLGNGVSLTFAGVAAAGQTTLAALVGPDEVPVARRGEPHVTYRIETTANVPAAQHISIEFTFEAEDFQDESSLHVFQREGGQWVDRTTNLDVGARRITATVSALSDFVIVEGNQAIPSQRPICDFASQNVLGLASLAQMQRRLGSVPVTTFEQGDLNHDGQINRTDVALFALQFGTNCFPTNSALPAPSPSLAEALAPATADVVHLRNARPAAAAVDQAMGVLTAKRRVTDFRGDVARQNSRRVVADVMTRPRETRQIAASHSHPQAIAHTLRARRSAGQARANASRHEFVNPLSITPSDSNT